MSDLTLALSALTGGAAGALDAIDGAGLGAGDAAVVIISSGVYHYTNIQDSAAEAIPYVVRPDNNPGTNSWHLVIPKGPFTRIKANKTAALNANHDTETTVIYNVENGDVLAEYNNTTGVFTATYDGQYLFTGVCRSASVAWGANKLARLSVISEGTSYYGVYQNSCGGFTGRLGVMCAISIPMSATDTAIFSFLHGQGGTIGTDTEANYNHMSIDRLT